MGEGDREEALRDMAEQGYLTSSQVAEAIGRSKAWVVTAARRGVVASIAVRRHRGSIVWIHRDDVAALRAAPDKLPRAVIDA